MTLSSQVYPPLTNEERINLELAKQVPLSVLHAATHGGYCTGAETEFFRQDGEPLEHGRHTALVWVVVGNTYGTAILHNDHGFITSIDPSDCPEYDNI